MKARHFHWRQTPGVGSFTVLTLLFLYLPLAVLVVYGFNGSSEATIWGGVSLKWFRRVLTNPDIGHAFRNSMVIAVTAMIVSTAVATAAALGLVRGRGWRGQVLVLGFAMLPLIVPEIVTAVTTLIFFSALGIHLGLINLIVAHTVFCIPFALLPIMARLRQMDATIENAARDLYADEWRVFTRVTLPLLLPAIASGAMLAFVSSLDDFLISMMVGDAGQTTLPVYIYGMMRLGVTPEVNAISTLILLSSTLIVVLAFAFTRHGSRAR